MNKDSNSEARVNPFKSPAVTLAEVKEDFLFEWNGHIFVVEAEYCPSWFPVATEYQFSVDGHTFRSSRLGSNKKIKFLFAHEGLEVQASFVPLETTIRVAKFRIDLGDESIAHSVVVGRWWINQLITVLLYVMLISALFVGAVFMGD